ncbi:MAG: substrate-binding periplasmic protein, partial [Turicibacter sp.]
MKRIVIGIMLVLGVTCTSVQASRSNEDRSSEKITVGYYEYEPYFYLDNEGKIAGLYHEIISRYAKDLGLEVEYRAEEFSVSIEMAKNGLIDVLIGFHFNEERAKSLLYSDMPIGKEEMAIYTKLPIAYGNLQELSGKKVALIKNEQNSEWLSSFLRAKGIEVEEVKVNSYDEAKRLLLIGQVDATIMSAYMEKFIKEKPIYHYSAGNVYITTGLGNEALLNVLNAKTAEYRNLKYDPISAIYNKYLPEEEDGKFELLA